MHKRGKVFFITLFMSVGIILILLIIPRVPFGDKDVIHKAILTANVKRAYVYDYENLELFSCYAEHLKKINEPVDLIIIPGILSSAPMNCFSDPYIDFPKEYNNPYWTDVFWQGERDYDNIRSFMSMLTNEGLCFRGTYVPLECFMHTPDGWDMENAEEAGYIITKNDIIITKDCPEPDLFVFHTEEGDFGVYFRENAKMRLPQWYLCLKELYYGIDIIDASKVLSEKTTPVLFETGEICLSQINSYRPYRWSIYAVLVFAIVFPFIQPRREFVGIVDKKKHQLIHFLIALAIVSVLAGVFFAAKRYEKIHMTGSGPVGYWKEITQNSKGEETVSWEMAEDGSFEITTAKKKYHGIWNIEENGTLYLNFVNRNGTYEQRWIYRIKETESGRFLNVYDPFGNTVLRFVSKGKSTDEKKEPPTSAANIFVNVSQNGSGELELVAIDLRDKDVAWISSVIKNDVFYMQVPVTLPVAGKEGELKINFDNQTFVVDIFEDVVSIHGETLDANIYAFDYTYFEEDLIEPIYRYVVNRNPGENIKIPETYFWDQPDMSDTDSHQH